MRCVLRVLLTLGLLLTGSCSDEEGTTTTPDSETPISGALVMPSGWEGSWQFTLTFRGCATQRTHAVERYSGTFAVGDTLGLMILPILGSCPGYIRGDSLVFSANDDFTDGGCTVTVDLEFGAQRNGDAITGTGRWTSTLSGTCAGQDYLTGCEEIELVGVRTTPAP